MPNGERRQAQSLHPGSLSEPVGTLQVALAHAARLLARDPCLAAAQAREILAQFPSLPQGRVLLARAERLSGRTLAALSLLQSLVQEQPEYAAAQLEYGIALGLVGREQEAVAALERAAEADFPDAWRVLADQLDALGERKAAEQARARHLSAVTKDPRLMQAAASLVANRLPEAEARLRAHLAAAPTDVAALRMLAEVAARLRRYPDARALLERCLALAPGFNAARHNLATVLNRQHKAAEALPHVEQLLAAEPGNPGYRTLHAALLANLGDYAGSIRVYEAFLREFPQQPRIWMSYGHSLKTAARSTEAIDAYRRAIALQPTLGEAYWSLANLKTVCFSAADVTAMRSALNQSDLGDDDRLHFEFALGKALEDKADYRQSFGHYSVGNDIRRRQHAYDADEHTAFIERSMQMFSTAFLNAHRAHGNPELGPIFIVGLPRSGSTLLEQILASHSLVEGTMELPTLPALVLELEGRSPQENYLQVLASLSPAELRALGDRYLDATRVHRKTAAPYFIDKMPNNCLYTGLLQIILPNARIIDARRHPLACCFSNFKQHFARGQNFAYSLTDLGRYYHDYVRLMAHFERVSPGRVHRVFYEQLIEDTETQVRRLLAYCGLPFEADCLRFYENGRAVRTASSEQVRQPIFREGLDHWRHYEPWLDALKAALGPVLTCYPEVPVFATAC